MHAYVYKYIFVYIYIYVYVYVNATAYMCVFLLGESSILNGTQYKLRNSASQNHCSDKTDSKKKRKICQPKS